MEFNVADECLTASGGSFRVNYQCQVKVEPGDGEVEIVVASTLPENPSPELLRGSIEYIRRGAEEVLRTRGLRAVLRIQNLLIHDVDCWPPRYAKPTAEGLKQCLDEAV